MIEPFNQGSNISIICSLSLTGVEATVSIDGAIDTRVFDAFVEHVLAPTLLKDEIVLLDNVIFHFSVRLSA